MKSGRLGRYQNGENGTPILLTGIIHCVKLYLRFILCVFRIAISGQWVKASLAQGWSGSRNCFLFQVASPV